MRLYTKEAIKHFSEFLKIDIEDIIQKCKPPKKADKSYDLAISDIHAPFQDKVVFNEVKGKGGRRVFITGDWFDLFTKSRFKQRVNPPIDFRWEFGQAYKDLVEFCGEFSEVNFMLGNHDTRLAKHIYDNATPGILPFCNHKVLDDLLSLIPNLRIIKQKTTFGREIDYIYQWRDIVFTHAEKSAADPMKAVIEVSKHLDKFRLVYNIKNYNAIIQGHNHVMGSVPYGAYMLYAIPCLIDPASPAFDYVFSGKIGGNPTVKGFMEIRYTPDNKIDTNETRLFQRF